MPSEIFGFAPSPVSMLSSTASTSSPFWNSSLGCLTRWVHDMSLMWTRPSMPSSISTKTPKSAMLRTWPLTTVPGGYFSVSCSYGLGSELFLAERVPVLLGVDVEHDRLDHVAHGDHLRRVLHAARPRHLGDVDEAFDTFLELDEGAVVLERDHLAADDRAGNVLLG